MELERTTPPGSASILMVDDHLPNLLALEAILEPLGQRLIRAQSGQEALAHLLREEVACILMDVQMPLLDGMETARLIKERERTRHIPILFLTATSSDASFIFKGYRHGAVDYLVKPFEPEILASKVSVFVELYARGRRIKEQGDLLLQREREALERRSSERYRRLTDLMPLCVWAARPDGEIDYCNRHWTEYTGLSTEKSAHGGVFAAVHPLDREQVRRAWQMAVLAGEPMELEYRLLRAEDREYRWHLLRTVPERDEQGTTTGFVATSTDIEDQKRTSMQERQARQESENANRMKDEFLAIVSHELRSPLNAILGWTRLLRTGELEPPRASRALEVIERNSIAQKELIEELLDVSRIISGKFRLTQRPIVLGSVVGAALDGARPAADAAGVELTWELGSTEARVMGDSARLQQVCWNLLSNAIKFTPRGGKVEVTLRRDGSDLELCVKDNGEGIEKEFLPRVFDRFHQADSSATRSHGGLGLGLSIVRHVVEAHGGTVSVDSDGLGKGSVFTVRLPELADEKTQTAQPDVDLTPPMTPRRALHGARLLVVDDDGVALLPREGHGQHLAAHVRVAGSAQEALEALRDGVPDVIISDLGMPKEDGCAMMRRIRALPGDDGGNVPAIALSGFARNEDASQSLAAGFQAHLTKPVEPAKLVSTVAKLLKV